MQTDIELVFSSTPAPPPAHTPYLRTHQLLKITVQSNESNEFWANQLQTVCGKYCILRPPVVRLFILGSLRLTHQSHNKVKVNVELSDITESQTKTYWTEDKMDFIISVSMDNA